MDSEKFDKVVLDLLYDELDELTRAAAQRHIEQSSRAKSIFAELRATREVGTLPLVEPPDDLEASILAAEQEARAHRPLKERIGSGVSILASYAMRPQLAMAALLLLMIGASLIFVRPRPGAHDTMHVTERGVPEAEGDTAAAAPVPEPGRAAPADQAHGVLQSFRDKEEERASGEAVARSERPAATSPADRSGFESSRGGKSADTAPPAGFATEKEAKRASEAAPGSAYGGAMLAYREGRHEDAIRGFDEVASGGGPNAASARLFAALSARNASGCRAALPRFEDAASAHPGSATAQEATWLAAQCHRELGAAEQARTALRSLLDTDEYGERARSVLAAMATGADDVEARAARSAAGQRAEERPAAAPPPPPAKPAEQQER